MAFVGVAVVGGIVIGGIVPEAQEQGTVWIPAIIAFATVPLSVGVAVLRYRLYEIDQIVSRTIGWAAVSAILVVVFAAGILATQAALSLFTSSNTLAVAVSTLAVAALFQPLRRRVQGRVDRRFNRARYDAERTVAAFSGRLRDEVDLDQLAAESRPPCPAPSGPSLSCYGCGNRRKPTHGQLLITTDVVTGASRSQRSGSRRRGRSRARSPPGA